MVLDGIDRGGAAGAVLGSRSACSNRGLLYSRQTAAGVDSYFRDRRTVDHRCQGTYNRPRKTSQGNIIVRLIEFATITSGCALAGQIHFSFTFFDVPGANSTLATGINNNGQIAGISAEIPTLGFLRDVSGGFTIFNVPGATITEACGINTAGQIVGDFNDSMGAHGFMRDPAGSFTTIDVPGASHTAEARGINDAGEVAGFFFTTAAHGFVRDTAGGFTIIDVPGAQSTFATGINESGQIAGVFSGSNFIAHSFIRDTTGAFTTFDPPGSTASQAFGINAAGQVVGVFGDLAGTHGFLRDPEGSFTTIDAPGISFTEALGINDLGQIAGRIVDANRRSHGFVATPEAAEVPEPSSLLLVLGPMLAGMTRRREATWHENDERS